MTFQFPELRQLLGAYFHQDWTLDDPDEAAVFRRMVTEKPRSALEAAHRELEALLKTPMSDEALDAFVSDQLSCDYSPQGMLMRSWLEEVRQVLENSLQRDA